MGWFDGRSSVSSSSVRRRSPSRRSVYSGQSRSGQSRSAPSIFSVGGMSRAGRSSPSVFSSSSSRRAKPRSGFIQRIVGFIKKLFRDIFQYARRNPAKVLFMVVIPLLTSGVLAKLLGMIGIRLPRSLSGAAAGAGQAGGSGMNLNSLMNVAKMFM